MTAPSPETAALAASGLTKRFGAFVATDRVSLTVSAGARHALIGPNGAGKTTLVNLLSGAARPSAGTVHLGGVDVTALPPHRRVKLGLARSFQINRLFAEMTVLESIALAVRERRGLGGRWWRAAADWADATDEAAALLVRLGLDDVAARRTSELPYGRQRLLEVGLALALRPRVLLLDEPAAGIPAAESRPLIEMLAGLPREIAIVLIEHDMDLVFRFAERITVLADGAILAEGPPAAIARDPLVRRSYLGEAGLG